MNAYSCRGAEVMCHEIALTAPFTGVLTLYLKVASGLIWPELRSEFKMPGPGESLRWSHRSRRSTSAISRNSAASTSAPREWHFKGIRENLVPRS